MVRNIPARNDKKQGPVGPWLLYPEKLLFKIKGDIRSFPDNQELKEFVNTKPVLQQM